MTTQEKIERIANHYGLELQLLKTGEEASELLAEICKTILRRPSEDIQKRKVPISLVWELADVEVMLAQIKYLARLDEIVAEVAEQKLDRQLSRIKSEKKTDLPKTIETTIEKVKEGDKENE